MESHWEQKAIEQDLKLWGPTYLGALFEQKPPQATGDRFKAFEHGMIEECHLEMDWDESQAPERLPTRPTISQLLIDEIIN